MSVLVVSLLGGLVLLLSGVIIYLYIKVRKSEELVKEARRELLEYSKQNNILTQKVSHANGVINAKNKNLQKSFQLRFDSFKALIDLIYFTSDNIPKFKDKIANFLIMGKNNGQLYNFCSDIVTLSNICGNNFIESLKNEYKLTQTEIKVCCLILWGFKYYQICTIDNINESAYYTRCCRIRAKLGVDKDSSIEDFIRDYYRNCQ